MIKLAQKLNTIEYYDFNELDYLFELITSSSHVIKTKNKEFYSYYEDINDIQFIIDTEHENNSYNLTLYISRYKDNEQYEAIDDLDNIWIEGFNDSILYKNGKCFALLLLYICYKNNILNKVLPELKALCEDNTLCIQINKICLNYSKSVSNILTEILNILEDKINLILNSKEIVKFKYSNIAYLIKDFIENKYMIIDVENKLRNKCI